MSPFMDDSPDVIPDPFLVVARLIKLITDHSDTPNSKGKTRDLIEREPAKDGENTGMKITTILGN